MQLAIHKHFVYHLPVAYICALSARTSNSLLRLQRGIPRRSEEIWCLLPQHAGVIFFEWPQSACNTGLRMQSSRRFSRAAGAREVLGSGDVLQGEGLL